MNDLVLNLSTQDEHAIGNEFSNINVIYFISATSMSNFTVICNCY